MRALPLLLLLLGCSQTTVVKDAGTKPGLTCSDAINGCACVATSNTVDGGLACSPASLGTSAHCCAHTDNGVVDQCYCAKDGTCFSQGSVCTCNALPTPDGGTSATTCTKPMNGHCCKKVTDAAQGECRCSGAMCAMDETEVMGCSGLDGNLQCGPSTMSVSTCK